MGIWGMGRWVSPWRGGVGVGYHCRQCLSQLTFNVAFEGHDLVRAGLPP